MELLQLRYFCVVAKHENVTRASEELMVAQSSLSKTIKKLEMELGVSLFSRQGRHIRLNQMGTVFYESTQKALKALDAGVQQVKDASGSISGSVTVGPAAAINLMPKLFSEFMEQYPMIHVKAILCRFDLGSSTDYDVVFFASPDNFDSYKKVVILEDEELVLAVPKGHPLAGKKAVDLAEARDYPFVSYDRESSIHRLLMQYCQKAGFMPHIVFESDNTHTHIDFIRTGMGISLVPFRSMPGVFANDWLVPVHISNPITRRQGWMGWRDDGYLPKAVQCFLSFSREYFSREAFLNEIS